MPSYSPISGSGNDYFGFDCWFNDNGSVSASATSPNSHSATQGAQSQGTTETSDGSIYIYNYINANNSDREVYLTVSDNNPSVTPATGIWTLSITNNSGSDMTYHGWLFGSSMGVSLNSSNSQYTIGSPGTATSAITTGSFVSRWYWAASDGSTYYGGTPDRSDDISSFSSIGPRRDGAQKPDIAAPGQYIISALSSEASEAASSIVVAGKYFKSQGTSMATPVVAGCAALLLEQNPSLTYDQVKSYITSNAATDIYTDAVPNYYWGYGKLDIFKSMVKLVIPAVTPGREMLVYDEWASSSDIGVPDGFYIDVRFTPSSSGSVTGLYVFFSEGVFTDSIKTGIYSDDGSGKPNANLGSTVAVSQNVINSGTWNFINLQGTGVDVNGGTDYHAVIFWGTTSTEARVATDNGSVDNRSYYSSNGSTWNLYTSDFRMRPVVSTQSNLLPVEIASFSASEFDGKVRLKWSTATEVNNYGFEIERAVNNQQQSANNWDKIGFVKGSGNSNSNKSYSFVDESPIGSGRFTYRLKQIDFNGSFQYSPEVEVELNLAKYELEQNYPNPFNPITTIKFQLPNKDRVKITVYDVLGSKVADLLNKTLDAGIHKVDFNGTKFSSGVYLVKMEAANFTDTKKIMLIK